jgi:hypothetical protein
MFSFFKKLKNSSQSRQQPPWHGRQSIYSHIETNLDPITGRLAEDAVRLPDEERRYKPGELRWVAGGMDGAFGHHGGGGANDDAAKDIASLTVSISRAGRNSDKIKLYQMLESDTLLDYIDPALEMAIAKGIAREPHLHDFAIVLAKEAPDRGPVKFGIALLGLIRDPNDRSLITVLGKHEEFTLYTAVALTNMLEFPEPALYELARCVDGWGKIHLVERLANTQSAEIKDWLIRDGYKNFVMYEYLAHTCAQAGELHKALKANDLDQELFDSTGEIIEALINGGPAQDIDNYEYAAEVITHYLQHFPEHPKSLKHFLVLHAVLSYLSRDDWDEEKRSHNGMMSPVREQVVASAEELLDDEEWTLLAKTQLASSDEIDFYEGNRAADHLNIDTWSVHWQRLKDVPSEPGRWFQVMRLANEENIEDIIALAEGVIPFESITTGPANERGLGPEYIWHSCLDYILQDLRQFPGQGKKLILTGLASPVVRNRNMALKALAEWSLDIRDSEIDEGLRNAFEKEPNEDIKDRIRSVTEGKGIG